MVREERCPRGANSLEMRWYSCYWKKQCGNTSKRKRNKCLKFILSEYTFRLIKSFLLKGKIRLGSLQGLGKTRVEAKIVEKQPEILMLKENFQCPTLYFLDLICDRTVLLKSGHLYSGCRTVNCKPCPYQLHMAFKSKFTSYIKWSSGHIYDLTNLGYVCSLYCNSQGWGKKFSTLILIFWYLLSMFLLSRVLLLEKIYLIFQTIKIFNII